MSKIRQWLEEATKMFPPGEYQHHNFTINDDGKLELCIIQKEIYIPIVFDSDEDMNEGDPIECLNALKPEIEKVLKSEEKGDL